MDRVVLSYDAKISLYMKEEYGIGSNLHNDSGPPLELLQDGCTILFLGEGAQFRTGAWHPLLKI